MKLYSSWLSPYAARCRLQLHLKGIAAEIVDMPGAPKPPELYALNPIGKVPTLVDGDLVIAESEVICSYLEERFPQPSLLPADAAGRARVRLLARIADVYVMPAVFSLFPLVRAAARDRDAVRGIFARVELGLGHLAHFVGEGPHFCGSSLTLADCALVPHLAFAGWFLPLFAEEATLAVPPLLESRARAAREHPQVVRVLGEMERAFQALRERSQGGGAATTAPTRGLRSPGPGSTGERAS